MGFLNFTPFPNMRFPALDAAGERFGMALAKATYGIAADGTLEVARRQAPIALADRWFGEPGTSSVHIPSDVVPPKPGCDLIVNAVAHAPEGPRASWPCRVRLEDGRAALDVAFEAHGPASWERVRGRWRRGRAEAVERVPVRYERAFGGAQALGDEAGTVLAFEHNPVGAGYLPEPDRLRGDRWPVPQLLPPGGEAPAPGEEGPVVGLGAMPPSWLPRRRFGGTYDGAWMEETWPMWPADYDFRYHHSAHPELILEEPLQGGEAIRLEGLLPGGERVVRLPRTGLVLHHRAPGATQEVPMRLDTVVLDLASPDPSRHRAFLTWRARHPVDWKGTISIAAVEAAPREEAA